MENNKVKIDELKKGDIFSEISHYTFINTDGKNCTLKHHESGNTVELSTQYVSTLLSPANHYQKVVKVGKEDKLWTEKQILDAEKANEIKPGSVRVGDVRVPGIRTIFENIYSAQVFSVIFLKSPKELSTRALNKAKEAQLTEAVDKINKAAVSKKGVAAIASQVIKEIQENPILPIEKGEERLLVGYKTQFSSRDGRYNCMDMSINEIRPVNINTIIVLIFDGIRYELE